MQAAEKLDTDVAGDDTPPHVHWFDSIQIGPVAARNPYAYVIATVPPPFGDDANFGDGVNNVKLDHPIIRKDQTKSLRHLRCDDRVGRTRIKQTDAFGSVERKGSFN